MIMFEPLPKSLCPTQFESLKELLGYVAATHQHLPAFTCAGLTLSYLEIDELSTRFAAYLQTDTSLVPGDRIAIQLPNLLQFPIALFGAIKAGLVVVSTNPLTLPTR
jgi:long-chain acyl-CoA synthetase